MAGPSQTRPPPPSPCIVCPVCARAHRSHPAQEAADDDTWLFRCDLGVTDAEAREAMGLEDTATVLRLDGTSWGSEGSLLTDPLEAVSKATSSSKAAGAQEPPESVRVGDREFEVPPEEEQGMGPKGHLEAQQELEQESHQLTEVRRSRGRAGRGAGRGILLDVAAPAPSRPCAHTRAAHACHRAQWRAGPLRPLLRAPMPRGT